MTCEGVVENFTYTILEEPCASSWHFRWDGLYPEVCTWHQWYKHGKEATEGGISVRPSEEGPPHYAKISNGKEVPLHGAKEDGYLHSILEARLCGKAESCFRREFPDGADIRHLLRLPMSATLIEVVPCLLLTVAREREQIQFENPGSLYLYLLLDGSFDEVVLHPSDELKLNDVY